MSQLASPPEELLVVGALLAVTSLALLCFALARWEYKGLDMRKRLRKCASFQHGASLEINNPLAWRAIASEHVPTYKKREEDLDVASIRLNHCCRFLGRKNEAFVACYLTRKAHLRLKVAGQPNRATDIRFIR